ncbi:conjugal transfer protein TraF [Francisellaceae bacterium]|nr:conjugal transfer protein TraF [Francisellaceae bacterium]
MHKLLLILALMVSINTSFANVAADQINSLMQAKNNRAESSAKVPNTIKQLQSDYEFVLFYKSTCPHCHKFVPVLNDFARFYDIKIIAYSTDGGDIDGLQGKKMTADEYRQYFLQGGLKAVIPALYLKNKFTDQVYPVLFGEAQPYQLAQRVNELMKHIEAQPHV